MNLNKRKFLKTSLAAATLPFLSFNIFGESYPKKYHKITDEWSWSTSSITHWNDFHIYSKHSISGKNRSRFDEANLNEEYVLLAVGPFKWNQKHPFDIYVNKDKYYKIKNYKSEFLPNQFKYNEVSFDIVEFLGYTPKERVCIESGSGYVLYFLGEKFYKKIEPDIFGNGEKYKGWITDRYENVRPLTEEMHSKINYDLSRKKSYNEYLKEYNKKLIELKLI